MGNDGSITVWEESSEGRSPRVLGVERDSYRDFWADIVERVAKPWGRDFWLGRQAGSDAFSKEGVARRARGSGRCWGARKLKRGVRWGFQELGNWFLELVDVRGLKRQDARVAWEGTRAKRQYIGNNVRQLWMLESPKGQAESQGRKGRSKP